MKTAVTVQQRVAIIVSLVKVYSREAPQDAGGRAAALLKRYSDPAYVLQAVAQACLTPRAGDLFNYAEGVLKGDRRESAGREVNRKRMQAEKDLPLRQAEVI